MASASQISYLFDLGNRIITFFHLRGIWEVQYFSILKPLLLGSRAEDSSTYFLSRKSKSGGGSRKDSEREKPGLLVD